MYADAGPKSWCSVNYVAGKEHEAGNHELGYLRLAKGATLWQRAESDGLAQKSRHL